MDVVRIFCIRNMVHNDKVMIKDLIQAQGTLTEAIDYKIESELDRDKLAMLKRAKHEAMALLTTLRYVDQ